MTEESRNEDSSGRDVFVSYASQDVVVADGIVGTLEKHGIRCWIAPRDVTPGALYADGIIRAINEARVLVLVLSASSIASKHVGKEVERASSKGRPIITLKVDAAPLTTTLEYFLSESQWIDVSVLGMPAALVKLVNAVGEVLASPEQVRPAGAGVATLGSPVAKRSVATAKRVGLAAVVLVALGIAGSLVVHFSPSKPGSVPAVAVAPISDKSIAVLPFTDMSQKKDQEYFGDGMAEEILDLLAKIPGLTVIGRTSSFAFKGKNEDLRKIGTELNAAYVLEGGVRSSGEQVRITAQLINTKTGAHEWSETYDRPIGDVLKLQGAIAAAVVRELQLTVAERDLLARSTVKNAQAYDLVLRGRHVADRFDKEGYDAAAALFQQALDQDPTSADAAAELAFIYYLEGTDEILAPAVAFEQARRAADMALKLDPSTPRAHYVLGKVHMVYDWDWAAAAEEFQQVAKLAPGSPDASNGKARLSMALGRWEEASRHIQAALAQDPFELGSFEALAWVEMRRGHLSEAEAAMRHVLAIRPNYSWAHYYLGLVLLARGERRAALMEIQQERTDQAKRQGLAMVYYALDRKADSDSTIASMLQEDADVNAFGIAEAYASRTELDNAMQWLDRAYAQKDSAMYYLKGDPPLKTLEKDPRFKAFLKKMNLPE